MSFISRENIKPSLSLDQLKNQLKEVIDDPNLDFYIKGDTLLAAASFVFRDNVNKAYAGPRNYLQNDKYFTEYKVEDIEKGGVSAKLISPINGIKKVTVCISKED
jgi:hypothetical protein